MMGIIIDIVLLLQLIELVDSFVSTSSNFNNINSKHQSCANTNHIGPLHAENSKTPLIVVGSTGEALAAAMALCTRDVLANNIQKEDRQSPIPPAQQVAFFQKTSDDNKPQQRLSSETVSSLQNALLFLGPTLESYDQILANSLQLLSRIHQNDDSNADSCPVDPMLYTSIDFGCEQQHGMKAMESLSLTRNRFSFMGLNLNTNHLEQDLSRETADKWGNELSNLLIGGEVQSVALSMDIRTHLALLWANSIPKTNGVLGETSDVWSVRGTMQDELLLGNVCDGMIFEYNYDYSDPFGGCDPLLRPSAGYIVPSPITTDAKITNEQKANDAYASAYCVMIGSGLDPILSICLATSIKAIYIEYGTIDMNGVFCPPSYTWAMIDCIADYTINCTKSIRKEDGYPRKIYKDFGYM